jgi:enolase
VTAKIKSISAREILALRGELCLEVTVTTDTGAVGVATPEVGISTGTYEAEMLLDGEKRYGGRGVRKAARNVNEIIGPDLVGMDVSAQRAIDLRMIELDGTPTKKKLGANAIVGVSLAVAKAAANAADLPLWKYVGGPNACVLPMPIIGIGTGGRYRDPGNTRWYKPSYEFIPYGAGSIARGLEMIWEVRQELNGILKQRYGREVVQARGYQLAGKLKHDAELLDAMTQAINKAGYEGQIGLYFDAAADCYYQADIDKYVGIFTEGGKDKEQMLAQYQEFVANYPIVSLEDVLREDDLEGHAWFTEELGIEIVGDDLFTTNVTRLKRAAALGAANSMVLKITQVGTLTEALQACETCRLYGYNVHPCGSRGDVREIADYAVALDAGQVRAVDLNRLMAVEEELGSAAVWPGKALFKGKRNRG